MTTNDADRRRELDELSLLPETDERRREHLRSLTAHTDEAQREWCHVLAENEQLRLRLNRVSPPAGLTERILANKNADPHRIRPRTSAFRAAAAVVIAALAIYFVAARSGRTPSTTAMDTLNELAKTAAMDHAARPPLTVVTDDPIVLAHSFADKLPFEIVAPSPGYDAVLTGGRVCAFDDKPLLYTRWRQNAQSVALYQLDRALYGLRADMPPVELDIPREGASDARCRVRIWTNDRFAYIVIRDQYPRPGADS